MKVRKNKKGFTIVELVIVMAVIAVLAAVMIPTFSGIIEKANESHDTSLVANINTIVTMEQVVSGTPTDAIEIQRLIKSQGLSLETKSKGKYLWYDLDNNTVVLAGLHEDGIALPAANARGPVSDKGKFKEVITSPEDFVKGYLFITEESKDGLADAIYTLHNPDDANDLTKALEEIEEYGNEKLTAALKSFYARTAVMTEDGIVFAGDNKDVVDRVIVSGELETVEASAIATADKNDGVGVDDYPNVLVVDFHSGVTKTGEGVSAAMNSLSDVYFVYAGEELGALAGEVDKLISKNDRNEVIKSLTLVYIDQNGANLNTVGRVAEFTLDKLTYPFPYLLYGTDGQPYDFVNYSLRMDGSVPIPIDSNGYTLTDAEKLLIAPDGTLTIYAIFKPVSNQFVVDGKGYGSGAMTYMLANGKVTSGTVTVVSTDAKLDASLIGKASADLTLPAGVELLLPFTDDHTKFTQTFETKAYKSIKDNYAAEAPYDKATMTGKTNLTIAGNVNLTVAEGASVYVDAQRFYDRGTTVQSFITDECGVLVIEESGRITSYGDITAYGVIRGEGTIDAYGGSVSEVMTVYDWHGGTNAVACVGGTCTDLDLPIDGVAGWVLEQLVKPIVNTFLTGKDVVPFNNWKIEHIRVNTTIHDTTLYKAVGGIVVMETGVPVDFTLMGDEASAPLFVTTTGAKIMRSVADNGNAKITILAGQIHDAKKTIEMKDISSDFEHNGTKVGFTADAKIDFTKISLPLSHFDVNVADEASLTISNNLYKVLPGSNITVDAGGTLNINTKVVVCNSFNLVTQDGTATPEPYPNDLREATLVVNGTLKFNTDGKTNAAFAGEITSKAAGAQITVEKGTVSGHTFPEGYQDGGISGTWKATGDDALYKQPMLEGDGDTSTLSGTYTYAIGSEGSVSLSGWIKQ